MSQLASKNSVKSLRNNGCGSEEPASHGTGTIPQPLLAAPDSGMIVFSSSARILHMNGPARTLMALFGQSHELWPQMAPESMPSFLTEFCRDVLAQLQHQIDTETWAQFELRRICHMVTPSLLLTGFGVPDSTGRELRVVVTLDPLRAFPHPATDSVHLPPTAQVPGALPHADV